MHLGARHHGRTILALAAALLAQSCVHKPTMRLHHAEISGVSLNGFPPRAGVVMTVVVDVNNTNSYDVAVRSMRGEVTMANRFHLPIDYQPGTEGVWLPADKTTMVRIPVTVPVDIALALLRESAAAPVIPFRVTGRADVTASRTFKLERDDYAVDEQGTITREQIAQVIPNSLNPSGVAR